MNGCGIGKRFEACKFDMGKAHRVGKLKRERPYFNGNCKADVLKAGKLQEYLKPEK